jgi:peptidoglycan hydrolase-like protein with peptidoglycan-binding domain
MGRLPTSLLIIVFQLFVISCIRADEQVRELQEQLQKRHLFFGNTNGEFSPALTTALSRYQSKKGFPVTGRLDSDTCASLGIAHLAPPQVAPTPFVVAKTGEVRGLNGELLPSWTPLFAAAPDSPGIDPPLAGYNGTIAVLAAKPEEKIQSPGEGTKHQVRSARRRPTPRREANPLVLAYQTVNHALKLVFGDAQPTKKRDPKKRG